MSPPGLDHSYFRIGEEMNGSLQKISLRDKIGIKNTDEFAFGSLQPDRQRAGFETGAIDPMNTLNIKAALSQFVCARCR